MSKPNDLYTYPLYVNMQFFFCGVPFRLDTYSGCQHGCRYCFARASENFNYERRDSEKGLIRKTDPHLVNHMLVKSVDSSKTYNDINVEFLRRRVPIHWGGMSDPFQPCEKKWRVSKQVLGHLNWYQYPVVISTKGALAGDDEYIAMLKDGNNAMQVSLISDDDKITSGIEPGAPNATARLKIMEKLAHAGLWVACRIQPVIPASPVEEGLERLITKLAGAGVRHIVVEGLKIPMQLDKDWRACLNEVCGGKVEQEYKACEAALDGQEVILPAWRKWQYLEVCLETAHKYGMTVGAADNNMRDFGDVKACCGIDNLPGFENYWQLQSARVSEIARQKGICMASDLDNEWSGTCEFKFQSSTISPKVDGVAVSYPMRYYWDQVWALNDDGRSPSHLVNLDQKIVDGKVGYVFNDKREMLKRSHVKQHTMF